MSNMNSDDVERRKQVDYLRFMGDEIRISHEVELLDTVPSDSLPSKTFNDMVKQQIRRRKQVMCGLHREIRDLQKLL